MRIETPEREPAGWFVGVVDGDRLIGFVQLDPGLEFSRASTFGQPQAARDWLDVDRIREIAASRLGSGEEPGTPFFSYWLSPDRLGWIVPVDGPSGRRAVMVTGPTAFDLTED